MKFEEFKVEIEKVPSHNSYSIVGLDNARSYLQNLLYKIEESLLMNDINVNQYDEIKFDIIEGIFKLNNRINKINKYDKADYLMKQLGIEVFDHYIRANDMYEILTNEDKLKELISKLKMKAFW